MAVAGTEDTFNKKNITVKIVLRNNVITKEKLQLYFQKELYVIHVG